MPCPNEVNPWQRFAVWQVKWKGKSNHVRTCAQSADYGRDNGGLVPITVGPHSLFVYRYTPKQQHCVRGNQICSARLQLRRKVIGKI